MEEVLKIGLIAGIRCKDGRHFAELICHDADGRPVEILVPVSGECEQEGCDMCSQQKTCEIMAPVEIELGRSVVIRRDEPAATGSPA
jgi:hypothetical protein